MYLVTYGSHTDHINNHMVENGTKLFPHWTKSWLGWRLACWTPAKAKPKEPFNVGRWRRSIGREAPAKLVGGLGTVGCVSVSRNLKPLCGPNESLTHNFGRENPTCGCGCVFFRYRTWAALLPVTAAIRAQPVARRAMYSVSEIPSKRPSVSQKVLCQEPSLSVCLCHLQHQTLIQSLLWMRAVTGQKREVCLVFRCAWLSC